MATTPKTAPKTALARKSPAKPRTHAKRTAAPSTKANTTAFSIGAAILAVGAGIAGFLARHRLAALVSPDNAGHKAPDLAPGTPRDTRAPVDFRPNMEAPISAADREALRPATGPAPSLTADAGTLNSRTGASN